MHVCYMFIKRDDDEFLFASSLMLCLNYFTGFSDTKHSKLNSGASSQPCAMYAFIALISLHK